MPVDPADAFAEAFDAQLPTTYAVGTVTATPAPRVTVTVRGGTKTLPRLASYSPTVGDSVLVACVPGAWVVLGEFA